MIHFPGRPGSATPKSVESLATAQEQRQWRAEVSKAVKDVGLSGDKVVLERLTDLAGTGTIAGHPLRVLRDGFGACVEVDKRAVWVFEKAKPGQEPVIELLAVVPGAPRKIPVTPEQARSFLLDGVAPKQLAPIADRFD